MKKKDTSKKEDRKVICKMLLESLIKVSRVKSLSTSPHVALVLEFPSSLPPLLPSWPGVAVTWGTLEILAE